MATEAYIDYCDKQGYINCMAMYRGETAPESRDMQFGKPELSEASYYDTYMWIPDFLERYKDYLLVNAQNYKSFVPVRNHSLVILDRVQKYINLEDIIAYLSPKRVFIIQQADALQKIICPAAYVCEKEVSDPQVILSASFEQCKFRKFKQHGYYCLTILEKELSQEASRYSGLFKGLSEQLVALYRSFNYSNFNTKLSKRTIIFYEQSDRWLAEELASSVGGILFDGANLSDGFLHSVVLYNYQDTTQIINSSFLITQINEHNLYEEFDKLYESEESDPTFNIIIEGRRKVGNADILASKPDVILHSIANNAEIPIDSNLQISTLFMAETTNQKLKEDREEMFEYVKVLTELSKEEEIELILQNKTDDEILESMHRKCGSLLPDTERIDRAVNEFTKMYERYLSNIRFFNLTDLGCGDGKPSEAIASFLHIESDNVIGIDIRDIVSTNIHFIESDLETELNLPDASCELVTITEVLHHIKNWDKLLERAYQKIEYNGYLIIRESLTEDWVDSLVLDVEHSLYAVLNNEMSSEEYITEFFTHYIEKKVICDVLEEIGFRIIVCMKEYKNDKFNKHWIVCEKANHIKIELKE